MSDARRIAPTILRLVERMPDAAACVDRDLRVIHANGAFLRLGGVRRPLLTSGGLQGVCHEIFGLACGEGRCLAALAMQLDRAMRHDDAEGSKGRHFVVTAIPIENDDGALLAIEMYREITAEIGMQGRYKELLREARGQADALQEEVQRRTNDLRESLNELQRSREQRLREQMDRERTASIAQMVVGIAHEVNTPIGIANAAAVALRAILASEEVVGALSSAHAEDLVDLQQSAELISRNLTRADDLIRSFKHLSSAQLTDRLEVVDLGECAADIARLYAPQARKTGLEIVVKDELPPEARRWHGYPGHLNQILTNFFANAQRYAYRDVLGGRVEVLLRASRAAENVRFSIEVHDFGAGIAPDVLPRIFDPFFSTGKDVGGTGLGLSIVANLVTGVLGGTIRCESELGRGSTFFVELAECSSEVPPPSQR